MHLTLEFNSTLLLVAVALATWILFKWLEYRNLPPGPLGFPIIGYIPFLRKDAHKVLMNLGKKYGNIISINMGGSQCIVINDSDGVKKILNNTAAVGRPYKLGRLFPCGGGFGLNNGENWQEQRRFCVKAMRDLGMGKGEWETMIQDETFEFVEEIKGWEGKPKEFLPSLESSIAGNNLSLLIGRKVSRDKSSSERQILFDFMHVFMAEVSSSAFVVHVPEIVLKILRWLRVNYIESIYKCKDDFEDLLRKEIHNNMEFPDFTEKPTLIKFYIDEMKNQEKTDKKHYFSVDNLIGNISVLFLGGVDTTALSLHWLLLIMATYPEVQKMVHCEIDDKAGKSRQIYWDEHNDFPYVMATINEMERWVALVPLFPLRIALESFKVDHYTIPKGTPIVANGWAIARDQRYHEDADDFKPGRFLSENNQLKKLESNMPFSWGKRNCPGESVAMMTMFLYFTAIMQKFGVICPEGKSILLEDVGKGVTRHAIPQELHFIKR